MEGQMAKSRCTGLGHKGATHNPQRLNVAQLIVDVLHQTIPHPCPLAVAKRAQWCALVWDPLLAGHPVFGEASVAIATGNEPAVDARASRQVLLSFLHHCLDINLHSHGLAGGKLWSA